MSAASTPRGPPRHAAPSPPERHLLLAPARPAVLAPPVPLRTRASSRPSVCDIADEFLPLPGYSTYRGAPPAAPVPYMSGRAHATSPDSGEEGSAEATVDTSIESLSDQEDDEDWV